MRELRDAIRQWARTPVITAVVVLSLALGIGANTAIFSLIDSLLLRPLPVEAPDTLVRIQEPNVNNHGLPVWDQVRSTPIFESTAVMTLLRPDISATPERRSAQGLSVSGNFFELLGVRPAIGRLFTPDDDLSGAAAVAVVDYEFWRSAHGGSPNILGASMLLDGKPFTIVGVTERGFFGLNVGRRFDVAIALNGYRTLYPGSIDSIRNSFTIIARLRAGQSIREAESALRSWQPQFRANLQVPDGQPFLRQPWNVLPIATGLSAAARERYAGPLTVLMVLVALVLIIACANVANVLLARASARRGDLAVRLSIGASRWQVLRSLLIESLVIALAGAAAAMIVGLWSARAIVNAVAVNQSGPLSTWIDVPLDYRVFAFTIAIGVATATIFGIGPALWTTRVDPLDAMRQRARGTIEGGGRLAQSLVAFQVALAFLLVFGGTLLVRSFVAMTTQDLGFDAERIVVAVPDFSRSRVGRRERVAVAEHVRERLKAHGGVEGAALVESTPFGLGYGVTPFTIPGRTIADTTIPINRVGGGYFETTGMALGAGRTFEEFGIESAQAAIVNESFARRYFPDVNPLGQAIRLSMPARPQVEIVGVIADARFTSLREPVPPMLYVPFVPQDEPWVEINIRSRLPEAALKTLVLEAMADLAPGAGVEFRSIESGMRYASARDRVVAWLAAGFALLALLLSAIGLYGVMAHQVIRRTQEFGLRMAVGAAPALVMGMVLKQTAIVIAAGLALGMAGAVAGGRLIEAMLFGLSSTDPATAAAAAAFLAAITLLAGLIPALRAARVDPMTALREE